MRWTVTIINCFSFPQGHAELGEVLRTAALTANGSAGSQKSHPACVLSNFFNVINRKQRVWLLYCMYSMYSTEHEYKNNRI